jgi:hypothetical protein
MSQIEKLNNVSHGDVKVVTERSADYGDNIMFLPVYPNEMRAMQACYPLLFYKDNAKNTFHPIALFGFEEGENLFLTEDGWDAPYLPLMAQRGPMMIGFDKGPEGAQQAFMAIDLDHPRAGRESGEPLFLEQGGNTDYLDRLTQIMEMIHVGNQVGEKFVKTLQEMELITPCSLKITLQDGSNNELAGFYMVDDEKLAGLDAQALEPLIKENLLMAAFMMVASMSQLQDLIQRRNGRLVAATA